MRTLIAAAALTVLAGAAYAGEGNGNPFPYAAPTQAYSLNNYKQVPGTAQNPYPFSVPAAAAAHDEVFMPVGSAGEVQSVNSLPRGFEDGTPVAVANREITAPMPNRVAQR